MTASTPCSATRSAAAIPAPCKACWLSRLSRELTAHVPVSTTTKYAARPKRSSRRSSKPGSFAATATFIAIPRRARLPNKSGEPAGHPPVSVSYDHHGRRHQEHPHQGGVNQDGDGETQAHLLDGDVVSKDKAREHHDHDGGGGGDHPPPWPRSRAQRFPRYCTRSDNFPAPLKAGTPHSPWLSLIHISEPTRRTPISYAVFCLK